MRKLFGFISTVAVLVAWSAPSQAVIYGMKSCYDNLYCPGAVSSGGSGGPPTGMFSFNEDGTGVTYLGEMNIGGIDINADAMAISHNHGLLAFEVGPNGSRLLSVATNGSSTAIGGFMSNRNIRGATFDLNDNLIVLDAATSQLLRIDPVTGLIIGAPLALSLGTSSYTLTDGIDIAVRPDGTLIMVAYEHPATKFYDINPTTGALNLLHSDGAIEPVGGNPPFYPGITYSQSGGTTLFGYEANAFEDVFTYSDTWVRSHLIQGLPPGYNAGRGDLAALMPLLPPPQTDDVPAPGALALLGTALVLFPVSRRRKRT